jgi:iron complex outermembrane recepter protein
MRHFTLSSGAFSVCHVAGARAFRHQSNVRVEITAAVAVAALWWGCAANAQTQTADNAARVGDKSAKPSTELAEVIVTAQKREQRLNDVGLSVTVADGNQLKTAGITDVVDLPKIVSGFTATRSAYGFPVFSMRGVNLNLPYISAQPAVSTYVDEALLAYPAMTEGIFLDVAQVEVLKGPQGTLFGQNSTGGAINVIAAKPTPYFTAGLQASVNQFGEFSPEAFVSGPLSDSLAGRVAVSTTQFGAWQKCYYACDFTNGSANRGAARMLLDWQASTALKVSLNLNGSYDHGQPQALQLSKVYIQVPPGYPGLASFPLPPHNDRSVDFDPGFQPREHDSSYQAVLRADWSFSDSAALTSITNYAHTDRYQIKDSDGTTLPIAQDSGFGSVGSFSQELRLGGQLSSGTLHYILGASYQNDVLLDGVQGNYLNYSGFPPNVDIIARNPVGYRSTGYFGNVDWEFTPGLTLTGGVRYASLKESVGGCLADSGSGVGAGLFQFLSNLVRSQDGLPANSAFQPGGCITLDDRPAVANTPAALLPYSAALSQDEHNVSWRGGINYKPTIDTLLYALVSRGFKAGGYATGYNTNASQFASIKQEELTAYELGVKTALLQHALDIDGAVFYYDYLNKQFLTYFPSAVGSVQTLRNIPKSSVKGAELTATAHPLSGLDVRAAATYIDTRLGPFSAFNPAGQLAPVGGTRFNLAPAWTGNAGGEYHFGVGRGLEAFVGADATFSSSTYADLGEPAAYKLPSYVTVDARIGLQNERTWRAYFFVRNLADKWYVTNIFLTADALLATTGLPRTFGVTVSATLGGP